MEPLVELQNVTFGYGATPVLERVSLHLHAGQFAALVGPSGAGKTTLLKLLLGVLRPNRGRVLVDGRVLNGHPSPCVAYVPQLETVDWNFPVTAEQVVCMGLAQRSGRLPWPSADAHRRVQAVLDQLEIGEYGKRHIRDLSGGQQQRVFLARALVARPDLLVLDEPTSGVDVRSAENVLHLLAHLNCGGMTIVMTTHDLNAAAAHLPWVVCLNRRVIAEGTPEQVFTPETLRAAYDGEFVVARQNGLIFIQQQPHSHTWRDVVPAPVPGHPCADVDEAGARAAPSTGSGAGEVSNGIAAGTVPV